MTGRLLRASLAAGLILALGSRLVALELFVAPDGHDENPGTRPLPLASLEAARDRIRALRAGSATPGPVTVWIRGGTLRRAGPLELTAQDSGSPPAPVVYRGAPGETARITGGAVIPAGAWTTLDERPVLERLDPSVRGRVLCCDLAALGITDHGEMSILAPMLELFSGGRRLPLAGWPDGGYAPIGEVIEEAEDGTRRVTSGSKRGRTFRYRGDRPRRWLHAQDLVLHGFWWFGWMDQHVRVDSIDPGRGEITLAEVPGGGIRQRQRYRALNLIEEMDRPGEWYLDRRRGLLYLLPPNGPQPLSDLAVSITTEPLITLDGVSHVSFRDLVFEVTRGVAVVIGGGSSCRLVGCTVRGVGSDAVAIDHGTENGLLGCHIHDVGGTAVRISGGNRATLTPSRSYVTSCHIHDFAQRKKVYRPGVRLHGVGHRITHNLIHHAPHQAIAYDGNDHRIEYNEIHSVVLESSDAGVIYTGCDWTFRGNVIRHNYIHDIPHGPGLGTVGVYLDDCASSTAILGNVFCRMNKPAFIGGGRDNRVENNVFVECEFPVYLDSRGLRWDHFRPDGPMYDKLRRWPYQKPPWSTRYPELATILDDAPQAPLGNTVLSNVIVRSTWRDPERYCRDTSEGNIDRPYLRLEHNLITDDDPGFVDAAHGDFRLREDAEVFERLPGFLRIPFESIGLLRGDPGT